MAYVRETVKNHQNQSSLPIKLETAYDILQPNRLSFDIAQIDRYLDLTDRGGGSSSSLCISSSTNGSKVSSNSSLAHVNNTLLTRLCVKALMSKRQGGFESPTVLFIDAGNCSDIYQCVNFARQYGLDIQKVMDSIIVSRPFNMHQLAGLLINELDASIVKQRFGAKIVVITDMLRTLAQDSQIDQNEARWLVKEIARSIRNLSRHVLVVASMHECPPQYRRILFPLFDNQIHIATVTRQPGRLQLKVSSRNNNLHNQEDDFDNSKRQQQSSSCILTERDLEIIIPAR
jgi:hypothetical protein